ncbi:hypothetical protein, partial [Vibrio harveyi]|uniref:hypothetical protein n=1 Tax=Vibrio harveyi TaxID=669 RepID=UPI001E54627A
MESLRKQHTSSEGGKEMTTQPILLTEAEVELLRKEVGKPSLMGKSIEANRKELEAFMRLPLDVPGHGEAGG